jgi:hypothetical protein
MTTEQKQYSKGGRPPKADPCRHRLAINLNDVDYAKFLTLYEASGLPDKARFITSCIFNRPLKVVKIDKAAMDYYMRLTTFYGQFRAIGVNYNQAGFIFRKQGTSNTKLSGANPLYFSMI